MTIGTVAFISLLCTVIAGVVGFIGGIRFSHWMNSIIKQQADDRFTEVVAHYTEKEMIARDLQEYIADLISKKVQIESEMGVKRSIFENASVPVSPDMTMNIRNMGKAARVERAAREEMEADSDDFPSAVSSSSRLFQIQSQEPDDKDFG